MPYTRSSNLPNYEAPPIEEVGIGIGFRPLDCWNSTAPGLFWQYLKDDYPNIEDQALLPPLVPGPRINLTPIPPVRRTWYVSNDSRSLVQVQADRLHANWRRVQDDDQYPRYGYIHKIFENALSKLSKYAESHNCALEVLAAEVIYVNNIPPGELWTSWDDLSGVLNGWATTNCGIGKVASLNHSLVIVRGESEELLDPGTQLTVDVNSAQSLDGSKDLLSVQFTARAKISPESIDDIHEWCGKTSESIVKAFTQLTTIKAHEAWKRTQ